MRVIILSVNEFYVHGYGIGKSYYFFIEMNIPIVLSLELESFVIEIEKHL